MLPQIMVVMTYKRVERLRLALLSVSDMMASAKLRHRPFELIVTQSVDQDIPDFTKPVVQLLQTMRTEHAHAFKSIEHITVPVQKEDSSFTNNLQLYGNKRNSMQNLMGGLRRAVERTQKVPSNIMVLEDDVILSCDILEYFSYASSQMAAVTVTDANSANGADGHNVDVASTELVSRPSFFVGNSDTNYFFERNNPSSTITVSANSRTVVKTYAWLLSQAYAKEYLHALVQVNSKEGDGIDDPTKTLFGCYFCEPYCYDHVVEWTLAKQGRRVMYPSVPRVTQTQGSGMTYAVNPVTPIYQLFVPEEMYTRDGLSPTGETAIWWFDLPGDSTWTHTGPSTGYYVAVVSMVLLCVLGWFIRLKIRRIQASSNVRIKRR